MPRPTPRMPTCSPRPPSARSTPTARPSSAPRAPPPWSHRRPANHRRGRPAHLRSARARDGSRSPSVPGRRPSRGAAAMAAALALALAPGPAGAVAPDALPESLWWRDRATTSLAREPLAAFDETRAFLLSAEWAPLYSGPDGARVEQARRFLRVASAPGPWRGGAAGVGSGGSGA